MKNDVTLREVESTNQRILGKSINYSQISCVYDYMPNSSIGQEIYWEQETRYQVNQQNRFLFLGLLLKVLESKQSIPGILNSRYRRFME